MHHGHLRTLVLAALRVQQPASVRQVCEVIAGAAAVPPNGDCVLHALLRLAADGAVTRRIGKPVTYRLAE